MKIENIKFKAKSILDGAWVQGDLVHKEDGKIAILRNGFNVSEVAPFHRLPVHRRKGYERKGDLYRRHHIQP